MCLKVTCVLVYASLMTVSSLPVDEDVGLPPTVVQDIGDLPISEQTTSHIPVVSMGFVHAFVASLSMIIVSELGDKTFFIAAIMAMRHPRITVFTGAISALALMTVLSGNNNTKYHLEFSIVLLYMFLLQRRRPFDESVFPLCIFNDFLYKRIEILMKVKILIDILHIFCFYYSFYANYISKKLLKTKTTRYNLT